jgi:large subunit ribosomal protein L31
MKKDIHPKYYPEAQVVCACGNSWITGATQEVIRTDVCSACHPFFTGEQRIVDTAGQVERFMRRLEKKVEIEGEGEATPGAE